MPVTADWQPYTTLSALLAYQAACQPDAIALSDRERALTYAALDASVLEVARGLVFEGIGAEDRIGYIGRNSLAYFELLFAAARIGAVMVPVGWQLSPREVAAIVTDAGLRLMFAEADVPKSALLDPAIVRSIGVHGDPLNHWRHGGSSVPQRSDDERDVVVQIYTSGTTGEPKGVMLTHRNLLRQRFLDKQAGLPWACWKGDDASLISMPVAHISGTGWALYGLSYGAHGIIERDFNPADILAIVEKECVTRMFVVPAALDMLTQEQAARPRAIGLRCISYGGAPIGQRLLQEVRAHFACDLVQLYGLTESTGAALALWPHDHHSADPAVLRSAGVALPDVEVRVADFASGALEPHGVGEVMLRGSGVMAGYWQRQAETADAIDADGWLKTGDIGELKDDGRLIILDRRKDMIITGGENVYPGEVEAAILEHPAVRECAVVGHPDARWGEAVVAYLVLDDDATVAFDAELLQEGLRERLARYKCPKQVIVTHALPRNATGKVLRRILRDAAATAGAQDAYCVRNGG